MARLLALLALVAALWAPAARADDIAASGRGVVRIVTIAIVDGEVVGFGHGSGFAIAPNRIVTNAHVVEIASRYPGNVIIGVVPSEGDKSFRGELIKIDPARDLALIEFGGVRLPPLTLFNGPVNDGETLIALGYPGNVDLATARSSADFITPLSPVRSQGFFSGRRSLSGIDVLLHTASIARGNSGGPLLDRCGRVLGVNSALTRADNGDASFGFAIANAELVGFLREAQQPFNAVTVNCVPVDERLAQEREAEQKAREAADLAARDARSKADAMRQAAIVAARDRVELTRENFIFGATFLLVLGALGIGAGGFFELRDQRQYAIYAATGGGGVMLIALLVFFFRPTFDEGDVRIPVAPAANADSAGGFGRMICRLDPARSRVNTSPGGDVRFEIARSGCVNGRVQYANTAQDYERIFVPNQDQTVSVVEYDPRTRQYTDRRYQLSQSKMNDARKLRAAVRIKQCSTDEAALADLAAQQSAIRSVLPERANEWLVYSCTADPAVPPKATPTK